LICDLPPPKWRPALVVADRCVFRSYNEVHSRLWRRRQWYRQGRHRCASHKPQTRFSSDKPLAASSTGLLLKMTGLNVTSIKIDPYMNIDAGTMRPQEHGEPHPKLKESRQSHPVRLGEVYVLNDGGEVDLDLGNYERYMDVTLSRDHNITTGKIYKEVIEKEVRSPFFPNPLSCVLHSVEETTSGKQSRYLQS